MKAKDQEKLDEMLLIKAEKERPGNTMPHVFKYEGKLYDTKKALDAMCMIYERKLAQSGGAK